MKPFLEHIVDDFTSQEPGSLKEICFVFPSKRACFYFRDVLISRYADKSFWSPTILSIEDFVVESHGKPITDEITLLFDLYKVYHKFDKSLAFDRFYSWGQVLLADFEEIDRYMADADKVYSSLKELEDIKVAFGEPEEVKKAIREFQRIFNHRESVLVNRFIRNWATIRKTYSAFNDLLDREGKCYKGRAFRTLAQELQSGKRSLPFSKIVFSGFNAFSKSEEVIITSLLETGLAEVYFDCDRMYMSDPNEEAGDFLRHYKKWWQKEHVHWIETDLMNSNHEIRFIGCTQMVGQAKVTGTLLKSKVNDEEDLRNTAVILADENLMMPVMHALPDNITQVNITMGYPFRNTTLYSFISRVFKVNSLRNEGKRGIIYPSEEVIGILMNTLVSPVFPFLSRKLARLIRKKNTRWVSTDQIRAELGDSWLFMVFDPAKDGLELLENTAAFLVRIFNHLKENEADPSDPEIIYHGLKHINRFKDNLKKQEFQADFAFIHKLFQETFRSLKIPFDGEPFEGMQIMGFLESRALDFKNVIVLGVNETKVPANHSGQTYLPFAVRKAFELPTFEEQEAIYAYHFKRVLQRAQKAFILFDTEVAVDGSGEKSRFIQQLQHKLERKELNENKASGLSMESKIIRNPMPGIKDDTEPIVVQKSEEVMDLIKSRYTAGSFDQKKPLSPTSLVNYIDCKLRFYLKYLAKIPEEELLMEDIDPRIFGTIVHRVIEEMYKPYMNTPLNKEDLQDLSSEKRVTELINNILIEENIISKGDVLQGKDILVASVVLRLIRKIITLDKKATPFEILGLEEPLTSEITLKNGEKIKLGGTPDRIDRIKNETEEYSRIIDYKTGKVDMVADSKSLIEDPEDYLEPYFTDGKYKAGFQAYYYASLMSEKNGNLPVKAGIFSTRSINDGIRFLRKGKYVDQIILDCYREKLTDLVEEILDPSIPIDQTEDLSKCRICAYKTICRR